MFIKNEVYFVGSNAGEPERIYFNRREAFESGDDFIDSFNENGVWAKSYKFDGEEYTEDF